MKRFVVTGAPGTGKTRLLESLAGLGAVIPEPARQLISEHRQATGEASLDGHPELFVERLIARSIENFDDPPAHEVVLYDRGLPDCVAYARGFALDSTAALEAAASRRYANPVFVLPPWQDIYTTDEMRRMSFELTQAFHADLVATYDSLGYELVSLPEATVGERAALVAGHIGQTTAG